MRMMSEYERLTGQKSRLEQDIETAISALADLENAAKTSGGDNLFAAALDSALAALTTAKEHEQATILAREDAAKRERDLHDEFSSARRNVSDLEAEHKALSRIISAGISTGSGEQNWVSVLESVSAKKGYETAWPPHWVTILTRALRQIRPCIGRGRRHRTRNSPPG